MRKYCVECGVELEKCYSGEVLKYLDELQLCFHCGFWFGAWCEKDSPNSVRVGGVHYFINPDKKKGVKGFGGKRFKIKFMDGRVAETCNLWHQGEIPDRWKSRIPDNAVSLGDTY